MAIQRGKSHFFLVIIVLVLGSCVTSSAFARTFHNKSAFIAYMLPRIQQTNAAIRYQRKQLDMIHQEWKNKHTLTPQNQQWLNRLAKEYHVPINKGLTHKTWQDLMSRVDMIPPSLVLAQAINESAWGRSRFARMGNNYFGKWCYHQGCGLVPKRRPKGAHYEVQKFSSALESVRNYMHLLNTGRSYTKVRSIRSIYRKQHKNMNGLALANGLGHYSERGKKYIGFIRSIILSNKLQQYDHDVA